jgi:hypothetical protein
MMRCVNLNALMAMVSVCGLTGVFVFAAPPSSESATTVPATRPVAALLSGTYQGKVVDDDEFVSCVTRFETYRGKVSGEYVVREGPARYRGTLSEYVMVDKDNLLCRFRWKDKHGEGLLTIQVAPDGKSFAGSWGKEFVQDELIWIGTRVDPATKPASESSSQRRKEHP